MSLRRCQQSLHLFACQRVNKMARSICVLLADTHSACGPYTTGPNRKVAVLTTRPFVSDNNITTKRHVHTPRRTLSQHSAHQFWICSVHKLHGRSSGLPLLTAHVRCYCSLPASSLWSSGLTDTYKSPVQVNLDLETRLSPQNVELLRHNLSARGLDFHLDQLLVAYECWKEIDKVKVKLEEERSVVAKAMAILVKDTKTSSERKAAQREELVERGKVVKEQLREVMPSWWAAEEKVMLHALKLPTHLHPLTPEEDQEIESTAGRVPTCDGTSHIQAGVNAGLLKFSNVGPKAVYLLGQLAELEQSLLHFASTSIALRGFSLMTGSDIFRTVVVEGCGLDQRNIEEVLTVHQKEDDQQGTNSYHLHGSSLLSYAAFFAKMQINPKHLPVKMHSVGRHYRPLKDKDLPGLYGPVQSNRVTMFAACPTRDAASEVYREMAAAAWDIMRGTGLPARSVQVSAKRLKRSESARTEVQVWAPSLRRFVQVAHSSVHDDYPSQRLMSRLSQGQPLHMVSGVTMDTAHVLASILEHSVVKDQVELMPVPCLQHQI